MDISAKRATILVKETQTTILVLLLSGTTVLSGEIFSTSLHQKRKTYTHSDEAVVMSFTAELMILNYYYMVLTYSILHNSIRQINHLLPYGAFAVFIL